MESKVRQPSESVAHYAIRRMAAEVSSIASRLYRSSSARAFLFVLSFFMIIAPLTIVVPAILDGRILFSIPLIVMFLAGFVGLRVAWKWGRYGD